MPQIKVTWRNGKCFRESYTSLRNQEDQPVHAKILRKMKIIQQLVKLILIEILGFLFSRLLPLNDRLPCRIMGDQAFVHRIQDGTLQMMVKIHRCLPFMRGRVIV